MRILSRDEFLRMPSGTLYAPLETPWSFGEISIKGESYNNDFLECGITWVEGDSSDEAVNRLEEMLADSSVSYPVQSTYGREGIFDNDIKYLIYEKEDIKSIFEELI